ncbi:hypothetical protein DB42_AQ00630 [Neochlamydia sp. EPS4]|uniref:hypothetical protein n=1 Tax=Neochlamydia sp. EPS4 TaxID=1478175 RepID=UPI0005839F92|nr:hypothetical protein [Neochlamydia sp. EPS4]KIC75083.1 hypothetical protein DB42_AQ00630 [Neochlamydia sp. EPS4]
MCSWHTFTILSIEISQLSQLQLLFLQNNQLTSVPTEIGQLSKLQCLNSDNKHLTNIPPEIGQIFQLNRLSLRYNQRRRFSSKKRFNLSGNCLISAGTEAS